MLKKFIEWCYTNQIMLVKNEEMFWISERLVIRPDFLVPGKGYIDIIHPDEINEVYLKGCQSFCHSHGTLLVIPVDVIPQLHTLTKRQLEDHFEIKL